MTYQWNIRRLTTQEETLQQQLQRELNISSAAARMLVVRDIQSAEEARQFIRPSLDKLHDPFLMKDMDKAVERLHQAITQGEKILIYGDYDVDGTTAVALMYRFLQNLASNLSPLTFNLDYYIVLLKSSNNDTGKLESLVKSFVALHVCKEIGNHHKT